MFNQIEAITKFNDAMRESGLSPKKRVLGTGSVERFGVDGDRGNEQSGWAVLHLDGVPAGIYGNWKTGERHKWCAVDRSTLPPRERDAVNKALAEAEMRRNKEAERMARVAATRATDALAKAEPAIAHPYLAAKGVGTYGARVLDDDLLISIHDTTGSITSLQRIAPDGGKRFLFGGRISGCFHMFGKPEGVTYICEGWATGATIHALTGRPVVVAFNAGNLLPAARAIRTAFPDALLVCAADDDRWGATNAGLRAAESLADLGIPFLLPKFPPDTADRPTDFNDMASLCGLAATREALAPPPGLAPSPAIPEDEDIPERWVVLPDVKGEKSTPIATIANLVEVMRRLSTIARYNVISKQEELIIPGESFTMDNKANASLAWLESRCAAYAMPTDKIGQFLTYISDQNQFNPVATWIESKPWDGRSRLPAFYNTIAVIDEDIDEHKREYKEMLLRRWLVSAVAAAYRPNGIAAQGVLVLQGDQAMGKTSWFKRLVPEELRADGITLDLRDKDSQLQALAFWLVELGELDATFRRSDIAQLKSFITRDRDSIRVAYAKRKSEFPRRTVFFASVNSVEFLHDETGNRRFWTIQCESIDFKHRIDMQQLWAEVAALYRNGESWALSGPELELVNAHNESFEVIDPVEDMIMSKLDWKSPTDSWTERTATDIAIEVGFSNPTSAHVRKAASIIKKYNSGRYRRVRGNRLLLAPKMRHL